MHLQAKEHQRLTTNRQKLGRGKDFLHKFQWEQSPAKTLIPDA